MPFRPFSDAATDRAVDQRGTLLSDGTLLPDGTIWYGDTPALDNGTGTAFAGFDGAYPDPAGLPPLDGILPPRIGDRIAPSGVAGTGTTSTGWSTTPAPFADSAAMAAPGGTSSTGSSTVASQAITVTAEAGAAAALGSQPTVTSGFSIVPIFDSSITSQPQPLMTEIEGAITAAIDYYESAITTPITVEIIFSYGDLRGIALPGTDVSESDAFGIGVPYSTLESALAAHDTTVPGASALPGSDPFAPGDTYEVANAEAAALGIVNYGTNVILGGFVALGSESSTVSFDFSATGSVPSNEYYAVGLMEHEISEDLGRVAVYAPGTYSPLDLFRYAAAGSIATSGTSAYFSINDGTTDLADFNNYALNGGDPGDWASDVTADSYDAFSFMGVANTVSATDLTVLDMLGYTLAAACYAAGTRILAARGDTPIEQLAVGDMVQTVAGGLVPVRWIGHRRIDCRTHDDPQTVWPIRITANAFGPGQPSRDLWLSPDHAVAVQGALVPVRLLANGASIRQDTDVAEVSYFHLELDRHGLVLAEGLAAESYLDTGNRDMFANAGGTARPAGAASDAAGQKRREAGSCLPLCTDPAQVEPIWQRLAARAQELGFILPVAATTTDPALAVTAAGRRFEPVLHHGGCYTFVLPALPNGARLWSRSAVPSALRPWLEDRRRLGVMVRRLVLHRGGAVVDVALDDPGLTDGWWAPEHDGAALWRWTTGDAGLPPIDQPAILAVSVGDTPPYPVAETVPLGTALAALPAAAACGAGTGAAATIGPATASR